MVTIDTPTLVKPSIALIGAGRVGSTLVRALHAAGYPIAAIASRTPDHAQTLAAQTGAPLTTFDQTPLLADLTLLAVSDDQLDAVVAALAAHGDDLHGRTFVHCSGVLPVAILAPLREHGAAIGGLHPLAAIAQRDQTLASSIAFAVEADAPTRDLLWQMARDLGGQPFDLRPEARPLYHAAAVLASNYTVVLAALATQLLGQAGMDSQDALRALFPLLRSTLANLEAVGLPNALTGPLVRGDTGTVADHLVALDEHAPITADAYRALARAALPLVAAQGALDSAVIEHLEQLVSAYAAL